MRKENFCGLSSFCTLQSSDVIHKEHDLFNSTYSKDKVGRGGLLHCSEVTSLFPLPNRLPNSQNSDQ